MLSIRASRAICPPNPTNPDQAQLLPSGVSTHGVLQVIAVVSTAITGVLTCGLILIHLLRYRVPTEQRQIIRLTTVPLVYATISLLQIYFYNAAEFLRPLADLYEAFVLVSLFMLIIHFAEPGPAHRDQILKPRGKIFSPALFQHVCVLVFQYPIVRLITTITTEASLATGRYCARSNNVQFASIWVTIIQTISVVLAVGSILRLFMVVKSDLAGHNASLKLVAFKLIIFLSFLQNLVFSILNARGSLNGSTYTSYYDISRGIPAALVCVECVIFSTVNLFAFNPSEYSAPSLLQAGGINVHLQGKSNSHENGMRGEDMSAIPHKASFVEAIISALNPQDILEGFRCATRIIFGAYQVARE